MSSVSQNLQGSKYLETFPEHLLPDLRFPSYPKQHVCCRLINNSRDRCPPPRRTPKLKDQRESMVKCLAKQLAIYKWSWTKNSDQVKPRYPGITYIAALRNNIHCCIRYHIAWSSQSEITRNRPLSCILSTAPQYHDRDGRIMSMCQQNGGIESSPVNLNYPTGGYWGYISLHIFIYMTGWWL